MSRILSELRFALRMLTRRPGFAVAAVLTLALGIGANTAIFSVVNASLLRPLAFREPGRLVWAQSVQPEHADWPFNLPEYLEYKQRNKTLDGLIAYAAFGANITGSGDAERLQGFRISADAFQVLGGTQAALGRTLLPEDDQPGKPKVAVISHGLWTRRFGADRAIVGSNIIINDTSYTVVGVLPKDFLIPSPRGVDVMVPLRAADDPARLQRASVSFLLMVGRLKPGVTMAAAQEDLTSVTQYLRTQFPKEYAQRERVKLMTLNQKVAGGYSLSLWVMLGAVAMVLFIACANLANLLLARASTRRKEIAIRRALGATGTGIVRLLLAESMILALAGGVSGALLASWGLPLLLRIAPSDLPRMAEAAIDPLVLTFTLGVSLLTGLLFGLAPAWQYSRRQNLEALKDGSKGDAEGALHGRFRGLLVAGEVALALMLLLSAGLFVRSFSRLQDVEPGFSADHTLVMRLSLPRPKYANREKLATFYDQLQPRIQSLPGVEKVGVTNVYPLSGPLASVNFNVVGEVVKADSGHEGTYRMVTTDYFASMGMAVKKGRGFRETDNGNAPVVVAVNESIAKKFFPHGDVIGGQLDILDSAGPRRVEIVGVVGDVKHDSLDGAPTLDIYIPARQIFAANATWLANNQFWVVRTSTDPLSLAESFKREMRSVDATVAVYNAKSGEQYLDGAIAQRRFTMSLVTVFAIAGLLLAAGGIYAVVSYTVSLRTREIAIRMALGARRGDILAMVIRDGMTLVAAGLGVGLLATLAVTRMLASLLFGVSPTDPATFSVVPLALAAAALLACLAPALRAVRVLPMLALRNE